MFSWQVLVAFDPNVRIIDISCKGTLCSLVVCVDQSASHEGRHWHAHVPDNADTTSIDAVLQSDGILVVCSFFPLVDGVADRLCRWRSCDCRNPTAN